MPRHLASFIAAAIALAPQLALSQETAAAWPDGWAPPYGQTCAPIPLGDERPIVGRFLDTSAVLGVMGWQSAQPPSGYAVWSVLFDPLGTVRQVRIVTSDLDNSVRARLESVIADVIERRPAGSPYGVQLRLLLSGGAHFLLGPSEVCEATAIMPVRLPRPPQSDIAPASAIPASPPTPTSEAIQRLATIRSLGRQHTARLVRFSARLTVLVDENGKALDAQLVRSSGNRQIDALAQHAAMIGDYLPALVDRMPTRGYAVFNYEHTESDERP